MSSGSGRPDWRRDLPFLVAAALIHGAVLAEDPSWRWGAAGQRDAERLITVEFVTAPPSDALASAPAQPAFGLGPAAPEKLDPSLKPAAAPKPVPVKRRLAKKVPRRPSLSPQAKAALVKKREAAAQKRQEALEMARFLAGQRALKTRLLAEARAARARKQADISRELAQMADPDEELVDAPNDPGSPGTASPEAGAGLSEQAPAEMAEVAPQPVGAGLGRGGKDVSWSLDGPVGQRRMLDRVLPESPDWVSQRGLDLSVQVRFQVLPDGSVHPGLAVKKTSGFPEIDRRAVESIRLWRFEKAKTPAAAWGSVRFRFTMG